MSPRSLLLKSEPRFGASLYGGHPHGHHRARSWLLEQGSLTSRLRSLCGSEFRVTVLREGWYRPFPCEAALLSVSSCMRVWTREVALLAADRPLVLARSLIPRGMLRGRHGDLRCLGQKPLGEWLFTNPDLCRLRLEFARITEIELPQLGGLANDARDELVGRRALYRVADRRILVAEFFLPELFRLEDERDGVAA